MSAVEYLTGLALVGIVVGGFWISSLRLRAWLMPGWHGAPALLGGIVLGLSAAVITAEILGLVGLLDPPALVIATVSLAVGLSRWRPGRTVGTAAPAPPAPRIGPVAITLAVAASVLTAIHWAGPVLQSLDVGMYRQDSVWYHLTFAAWFAQTGSVGGLLFTDPLKLTAWYYPLNSELLHAIGMVLLGNDLLSPLLNFGWMCVALLSAWCIGRPFGLAPVTLLASVLVVDSDMMLVQAGNAPSDIVALACLLAAIAILINGSAAKIATADRALHRVRLSFVMDRGPLTVGALAAGLAIGTKVTMLVPVAVVTVAVICARRSGVRRRTAIWLGGMLATGGFWYARNLIHAGNPLPWITFGPLSGPSQEALYPRPAHSIAEYIADRHAWTQYFLPGLGETLGPLWFVIVFGIFAGIVLGLRSRSGRAVRILALAAAATLIAHVFNPISASGPLGGPYGFTSNLRYAAPGMAIGLILLPLCESPRMARFGLTPVFALLVALTALASKEWVQPQPLTAVAIGALAVLVPVWLTRRVLSRRRILAAAAVVGLVVIAGYKQQRQYFADRYRANVAPPLDNPGFRATSQWRLIQTWAREQHGERIGIVGTPAAYGQYIFYGNDLSNEVRYIGEPRPFGGFGPVKSCRRWRELVDQGRFDQIVITPEEPGSPVIAPQIGWTALGGTAQSALQVLPAAVFTLTGPLDPSLCAYKGRVGGYAAPGQVYQSHLPPSLMQGVPGEREQPQLPPGGPLPQR